MNKKTALLAIIITIILITLTGCVPGDGTRKIGRASCRERV